MIKQAYGDAAMSRSSEAKLHAVALLEIPLHGERDDTSKQLFTGNSVLTLHKCTGYCAGRFLFVKAPPHHAEPVKLPSVALYGPQKISPTTY